MVAHSWSKRALTMLMFLIFISGCRNSETQESITIFHAPQEFSRRYADFTANITGTLTSAAKTAEYRLNDGTWRPVGSGEPRAPAPQFLIELLADEMNIGANRVEIRIAGQHQDIPIEQRSFTYDPTAVRLPLQKDWPQVGELDVEEGYWETFQTPEGGYRVRPKPGFEGWDRVLIVAGAFAAGRRVETEVVFRHTASKDRKYGFGVFPLWGGRPDSPGYSPRRGWNFSLVWYFGRYGGVGNEFSYKFGPEKPTWISSYHNLEIKPDRPYHIVAEVWPVLDHDGRHLAYHQRMKWWEAESVEPEYWLELTDRGGAPLPAGEYGVALVAYECQVEFGPVSVSALPADTDRGRLRTIEGRSPVTLREDDDKSIAVPAR